MLISVFGSCRQYSIAKYFKVTPIQERLTYPHYTKEVIQAIEYCKGINKFDNKLSAFCFRTGILDKKIINYQPELIKEFENSDLIVVEIASRICYEWNGLYVHHILTEPKYGFSDIQNIKIRDLSDEEIEADLIKIKDLIHPKKLLIVPHLWTRTTGKRYALVKLLEQLTNKHGIPFMNPSELLQNERDIYYGADTFHYTQKGEELIGREYKRVIDKLSSNAL